MEGNMGNNMEEGKTLSENAEEGLSPEEILVRAKKENEKFGDERQRGRLLLGQYAGFIATELAAVIVLLVVTIVEDRFPIEMFLILFTGLSAQNIAQACIYRKKVRVVSIVCATLITACTVMYWVLWILGLCGVNL